MTFDHVMRFAPPPTYRCPCGPKAGGCLDTVARPNRRRALRRRGAERSRGIASLPIAATIAAIIDVRKQRSMDAWASLTVSSLPFMRTLCPQRRRFQERAGRLIRRFIGQKRPTVEKLPSTFRRNCAERTLMNGHSLPNAGPKTPSYGVGFSGPVVTEMQSRPTDSTRDGPDDTLDQGRRSAATPRRPRSGRSNGDLLRCWSSRPISPAAGRTKTTVQTQT